MKQLVEAIYRDAASALCFFAILFFTYYSFPVNCDIFPLMIMFDMGMIFAFIACVLAYHNEK